ncbi:MAG: M17 family peptidase N-terminal domain-containing protein, partial [Gimesia chilikensis]
MKYAIDTAAPDKINSDCVVVVVWSKGVLSDEAAAIDKASDKQLSKITRSGDFKGKLADTCVLHGP